MAVNDNVLLLSLFPMSPPLFPYLPFSSLHTPPATLPRSHYTHGALAFYVVGSFVSPHTHTCPFTGGLYTRFVVDSPPRYVARRSMFTCHYHLPYYVPLFLPPHVWFGSTFLCWFPTRCSIPQLVVDSFVFGLRDSFSFWIVWTPFSSPSYRYARSFGSTLLVLRYPSPDTLTFALPRFAAPRTHTTTAFPVCLTWVTDTTYLTRFTGFFTILCLI